MHVNAPGQNESARGINLLPSAQAAAKLNDLAVVDAHIALG